MPLLEVSGVGDPPEGLLPLLQRELMAGFRVPADKAWVEWREARHRLPERGPELLLRCRRSQPGQRARDTLQSLRQLVARSCGVALSSVFAQLLQVEDEGVMERGSVGGSFGVEAVARVRNVRPRPLDDYWRDLPSRLVLTERFGPEALQELDSFTHVEVVFLFDQVPFQKVREGARHPRNRSDWPSAGIFAQRGKGRPNRIGVSRCRVVGIEGRELLVQDLDAIDGTPVLDIKPWMDEFGPIGPTGQPSWSRQLMDRYYLPAAEDPRET